MALAFLYSVLLKLLYPTSVSLLLLAVGAALRRRPTARRVCYLLAVLVLLVCGNGWVVAAMIRHLEGQHPPPHAMPSADAILVLSGGVLVEHRRARPWKLATRAIDFCTARSFIARARPPRLSARGMLQQGALLRARRPRTWPSCCSYSASRRAPS